MAYNLDGVDTGLKLTRDAYVDILAGQITNWSDSAIANADPHIELFSTGFIFFFPSLVTAFLELARSMDRFKNPGFSRQTELHQPRIYRVHPSYVMSNNT